MASIIKVDQVTTLDGTGYVSVGGKGFDLSAATSGIVLPSGTTAQRPAGAPAGMMRYNTTLDQVEVFDGVDWLAPGEVPVPDVLPLPTGYKIAMTFNDSAGGLLPASTWTITNNGTPGTYVTSGGVADSGYFSSAGRSVASNFFRITEETYLSGKNRTYSIWYKGTQTTGAVTYGPGMPLFGDIRNSVYGGIGTTGGKIEFRDSGNAYQGPNVNTGDWVHCAWTFSSGNQLKIYVNGALTNTYNSISINGNTRLTDIGAHYPYSGYTPPEAIDCAVVYDRVLSDAEIQEIYTAGSFIE